MTDVRVIDRPSQITVDWLQDVLDAAGEPGRVATVAVEPVGTGQMSTCFRIVATYDDRPGSTSMVAKLPVEDLQARRANAGAARTEVLFYREFAQDVSLPAPRCWLAAFDKDASTFTLVLDDAAPAVQGDQIEGCTVEEARNAAVAAADLHAATWCDPSLSSLRWTIPSSPEILEAMAGMVQVMVPRFLEHHPLDAETAAVVEEFGEVAHRWYVGRESPATLIHNDYRLDNLLFAPPGAEGPPVTVVDWATVTVGLPLRDVAYLLGTGLDPAARRESERSIVEDYHQALMARGVEDYPWDQCWEDYRYGLLHGPLICLLGFMVATPTERGREMFTAMATRSAVAVREHGSFDLVR